MSRGRVRAALTWAWVVVVIVRVGVVVGDQCLRQVEHFLALQSSSTRTPVSDIRFRDFRNSAGYDPAGPPGRPTPLKVGLPVYVLDSYLFNHKQE